MIPLDRLRKKGPLQGKRMKSACRGENTEEILNIKEERTRKLQDTMHFSSMYTLRRLKYEKVNRFEQTESFRKSYVGVSISKIR